MVLFFRLLLLFLLAVFARSHAGFLLETLGEILGIGETNAECDLRKVHLALHNQLLGTLHAKGAQEIAGRHTHDCLNLAIEHSTSHADGLGHLLDTQILVTDTFLEEFHEFLHHHLIGLDDLRRIQTIFGLFGAISLLDAISGWRLGSRVAHVFTELFKICLLQQATLRYDVGDTLAQVCGAERFGDVIINAGLKSLNAV